MAEQTQSPTIPAWQQAADPKLVRWLWRQLERPGLLHQQQAPRILARHQKLVAGVPLAESLHRRTAIGADPQAAQSAIVYVTPPPWSPPASLQAPTAAPLVAPTGQPLPVVTQARPVTQSRTALAANPAPPQAAASTTAQSGPPLVIQRQAMPGAAASTPPAPPNALPLASPPPPTVEAPPRIVNTAVRTADLPMLPRRSSDLPPLPRHTGDLALPATRASERPNIGVFPSRPSLNPLASAQLAPGDLPAQFGPPRLSIVLPTMQQPSEAPQVASSPVYPVVRARLPASPQRTPSVASTGPIAAADRLTTIVVHEQRPGSPPVQPALPVARPAEPLPLVTVTAPALPVTAESVRSTAPTVATQVVGSGRQQQALPAAQTSSQINPAPSAPHTRQPAVVTTPAAPVDIDSLVDKVHRRFLQTLALEGERRGRR